MSARFWRWINETDASKTNALLGALGFALTLIIVGVMSLIAFGSHVRYDRVIAIPPVWVDVLDSILIATAVWAGVSQAAQIGRRAATKPEVVRVEAEAEAAKVLAVAKADVVRRSGSFPAVDGSVYDAVDAPQTATVAAAHAHDPGA